MNVLIFVVTMLMLLAAMTYARLEVFRTSQIFQILFENYMEQDERGYINMAARKTYDSKRGSKKSNGNDGERVDASPRISLSILFNKTDQEKDPQAAASFKELLKNLMRTLYAAQPFFQEAEQNGFSDKIIDSLIVAVRQLPDDHKLKKASDIANLILGNDELQQVYYKMLYGAPSKEMNEVVKGYLPIVPKEESEGDVDPSDAKEVEEEAEEYQSPKGYESLLDFVTLRPVQKVRVYLAPREVLKAIYLDDAIVDDIIRKRQELYHLSKLTDKEGIKSLSDSFKNEFNNRQAPSIGPIFDYTVTKTNPKNYE